MPMRAEPEDIMNAFTRLPADASAATIREFVNMHFDPVVRPHGACPTPAALTRAPAGIRRGGLDPVGLVGQPVAARAHHERHHAAVGRRRARDLAHARPPRAALRRAAAAAALDAAAAPPNHRCGGAAARPATRRSRASSSYLASLPTVPGGRFRESYYWDSYWVILGLLASDMGDTARGLALNLVHFVVRTAAQSFSALWVSSRVRTPPLPTERVRTCAQRRARVLPHALAAAVALRHGGGRRQRHARRPAPALPSQLRLRDARRVRCVDRAATRRHSTSGGCACVHMLISLPEFARTPRSPRRAVPQIANPAGGEPLSLSRYYARSSVPRPESFVEDTHTAQGLPPSERALLWRGLASAAETGWDFSSRWFRCVLHVSGAGRQQHSQAACPASTDAHHAPPSPSHPRLDCVATRQRRAHAANDCGPARRAHRPELPARAVRSTQARPCVRAVNWGRAAGTTSFGLSLSRASSATASSSGRCEGWSTSREALLHVACCSLRGRHPRPCAPS